LNPLNWVRESFAVNKREKNTEEELEAARKAAAEKGEGSIFDTLTESSAKEDTEQDAGVVLKSKKQYTHVCQRVVGTLYYVSLP
jgi:large subunit ribosomal protein L22